MKILKRIRTISGYITLKLEDGSTVQEHRYLAEKALGKPLPKGCIVHHVDGNPGNNKKYNLVICQDQRYHSLLHKRTRDQGHLMYQPIYSILMKLRPCLSREVVQQSVIDYYNGEPE